MRRWRLTHKNFTLPENKILHLRNKSLRDDLFIWVENVSNKQRISKRGVFFGKINSLVCWSEWEDVIFEGGLCSCETLLGMLIGSCIFIVFLLKIFKLF